MAGANDEQLEIGHVLFIDIVGYSRLLIEDQKERLRRLTAIVLATTQVRETTNEQLVRLPTGDGMALVFRKSSEEPAQCAFEIASALKSHPEIQIRMGIHSGPVSEVTDLNERTNIAGAGINMAQRVMDCGDAGHILASARVANDLEQYTRWQPLVHDLGECAVKHGVRLRLANLYTAELGNRVVPQKLRMACRRRRITVSGAILLLGIIAAGAALFFHRPARLAMSAPALPEKSIAVLPFENLSEDKSNDYFAAGIQDEILTRLANLGDLKVIARTSTEKYQSHPADLGTIAAELGVAHVLEGSVQKIGNQVHVNVQLIKASSAAHIWAQSYDRTLDHAFAVQGEVAQTVANALKVALQPAQIDRLNSLPTQNPAAYDSYLKGEYALEQARKNPGDYQKAFEPAIARFQEAVAADPQFALAYAQLAYAELTKEEHGHLDGRTEHKPELLASAKQNVDRALQLQPDLPAARLALGRWHFAANHDATAAQKEYQRALELDPRLSEATARIASSLITQGRTEEAIALFLKGLESDPRNYQLLRNLGIAYTMRGDFKRASEVDSRIVAMNPADEQDACNLCLDIVQSTGDLQAARRVLDELISHLPAGQPKGARLTGTELFLLILNRDFAAAKTYAEKMPAENWETDWARPLALGDIAHYRGDKEAARDSYQNARGLLTTAVAKDPEEPQSHADLALVDAGLGLNEEALREAQRAIDLEPIEKHARAGLNWLLNLAQVQTRLGQSAEAINGLERLMAMPNTGEAISIWQLKLDPNWDPLRSDPRFQRMVESTSPKS